MASQDDSIEVECEPSPSMPKGNPPSPAQLSTGAIPSQSELDTINRAIVRKYDTRLIPIIFLSYTIFWIDRSNVALARINGLEEDLGLRDADFNIALSVFFALYVVFTVPANLVLRRVGGGLWLPLLMLAWGIVTLCSGFVTSFTGLIISRVFLGMTESGFLGGAMLWLGLFYTNQEIVARVGIFFSSMPLAGSIGGLLAGGLSRIQTNGYSHWPWIFIVEGVLTIILAFAAFFIMPDTPERAGFLSADERIIAKQRMLTSDQGQFFHRISSDDTEEAKIVTVTGLIPVATDRDQLTRSAWRRALLHPMTILMSLGSFLTIEAIYAYNLFVPTLIREMGFTGLSNSLMTVPPNFVAFIYTIVITQYSQRKGTVASLLMLSAGLGALGYMFLLIGSLAGATRPDGRPTIVIELQYVGTFLAASGVSALSPLAMSWVSINASPHYVRAISLGFMIGFGNIASVIASFAYIRSSAPRYIAGHSINIAFLVTLLLIGAMTLFWVRRENAKRSRGERDAVLEERNRAGMSKETFEIHLGWDHPRFRFIF